MVVQKNRDDVQTLRPPPVVDTRQIAGAGTGEVSGVFSVASIAGRAVDWTKSAWTSVSDAYASARYLVTGQIKDVQYRGGSEREINSTTRRLRGLACQIGEKWEIQVGQEGFIDDLRSKVREDYLSHVKGADGASERSFAVGCLTGSKDYDRIRHIEHSGKLLGQGENLASRFVESARRNGYDINSQTRNTDTPSNYATFKYKGASGLLEVSVSGNNEMVMRQGRKVYTSEVAADGNTHFYRILGHQDGTKAANLSTGDILNRADGINREEITRLGLVRTGTKHLSRIVNEFNATHKDSAQVSEVDVWARVRRDAAEPRKPTLRLSEYRWSEKEGAMATAYKHEAGTDETSATAMMFTQDKNGFLNLPDGGRIKVPRKGDMRFQPAKPEEIVEPAERSPVEKPDAGEKQSGQLSEQEAESDLSDLRESYGEKFTGDKVQTALERWSLATRANDPTSRTHYETYTKLDNAARSMGWTKVDPVGGGERVDDKRLCAALATVLEANEGLLSTPFHAMDGKDGAALIRSMRQFKSPPQYGTNLAKAFVELSRDRGSIPLSPDGSHRKQLTKPDEEIAVEFAQFAKELYTRLPKKWVEEYWAESRREVEEEARSPQKRVERALTAAKLDSGEVYDHLCNAARDVGWTHTTQVSDSTFTDEERIRDCLGTLLEDNRKMLSKPQVNAKDGEELLAQMQSFTGAVGKNFGDGVNARMKGYDIDTVWVRPDGTKENPADSIPNDGIALEFAQYMKKLYDSWQKEDTV
ncbi:MAG: hypothetical protein ABH834_06495 [Candidatus Altiarchaeota archaeon]